MTAEVIPQILLDTVTLPCLGLGHGVGELRPLTVAARIARRIIELAHAHGGMTQALHQVAMSEISPGSLDGEILDDTMVIGGRLR